MRSSNSPLQVFVEVVGLELIGICIDKFGSEDFYGIVENHVGYLIWVYEYLLGVRNPLNFPSCNTHFQYISFKPFQICGSILVHYGKPINI